jgi:hypothetical protein
MTELVGSLDINLPALFFMKPAKLNLHRMVGFNPALDQTWDKLLVCYNPWMFWSNPW